MDLPEGLRTQAEALIVLYAEGVAAYTPVVEHLIASNSRDTAELERTLDGLLGFACTDAGVQLYRRLCRYAWDVDPELAARAVNGYREMWDPDGEEPWRKPAAPQAPAADGRQRLSPDAVVRTKRCRRDAP
ncbi:MAG TPA: hypothetical protein DCS97_16485 [Planctomycetes bacterium]|nr:hypothetical protein [Planctomycetota bacterium]